MSELNLYAPIYVDGDPTKPLEILERFMSRSEIARKKKEGAIRIGRPHLEECWIKIGKALVIVQKNYSKVATDAQMSWEYHYQLMPKTIDWETL